MYNEIKRKITSLTLMTIMLAGGMTFAIPGVMPDAQAELAQTSNLSVSSKIFGGPMVLEIVVNDPNIDDLDFIIGKPTVTFGGNDLLMVQASNGNWYSYVGHTESIENLDKVTSNFPGGLDFGSKCSSEEADDIAIAESFDSAATIFAASELCSDSKSGKEINVIRSPKSINNATLAADKFVNGQIGLNGTGFWPFIQTFENFGDDSVINVEYNPGGSNQVIPVTFDHDMADYASFDLDRTKYPHGAQVHLTINDNQLNIDPTDEDIWTFDVSSVSTYYRLFDESGEATGPSFKDYKTHLQSNLFDGNGYLTIDPSPDTDDQIVFFQSNGNQKHNGFYDGESTDNWVTVQESSTNSGVFESFDNVHKSSIYTTDKIKFRGVTFIVDYNDKVSPLLDFFGGSVDTTSANVGDTWNSGESLEVIITDMDQNKNSRTTDDFDVASDANVPTIQIGDPFTLDSLIEIVYEGDLFGTVSPENKKLLSDRAGLMTNQTQIGEKIVDIKARVWSSISERDTNEAELRIAEANYTSTNTKLADVKKQIASIDGGTSDNPFSKVLSLLYESPDQSNQSFSINLGIDADFLYEFADTDGVYRLINYDRTSFDGNVKLEGNTNEINLPNSGLIHINSGDSAITGPLRLTFSDLSLTNGTYNVIFDVFTFGQDNNGTRYNDAIYRFEAEETGDNTGAYSGTLEYIMLNQINILDTSTFTSLDTIDDELVIIVHEDLTDEDAIEVIYYDRDAQGVQTQVSDQKDAPTQSGKVTFDNSSYKVGDTVTITLEDQDLNTDSDTTDIYTVVKTEGDIAVDTVGKSGTKDGLLLDVTFNDGRWTGCTDINTEEKLAGLAGSLNSLQETTKDSGIFTATFQIPERILSKSRRG